MSEASLAGRRVLVVEDEVMIAMLVETALQDEGCSIVGPCSNLGDALAAARDEALDLAVLDINLAGEMVFPVADLLADRGVPFLLLSGYGDLKLPGDRRHWPVCAKPFNLVALIAQLRQLLPAV